MVGIAELVGKTAIVVPSDLVVSELHVRARQPAEREESRGTSFERCFERLDRLLGTGDEEQPFAKELCRRLDGIGSFPGDARAVEQRYGLLQALQALVGMAMSEERRTIDLEKSNVPPHGNV